MSDADRRPIRILFVCHGNICRSPLADGVFNHLVREQGLQDRFIGESCGVIGYHTGEQPDPRMRDTASQHGIALQHSARRARRSDFDAYDLFLTMDIGNYHDLLQLTPDRSLRKRVQMFRDFDPQGSGDVPDPYYGGIDGFETVFRIVHRTCQNLLTQLQNGHSPAPKK